MNAVRAWLKAQLPYLKDLAERVFGAFVATFLGTLGLGEGLDVLSVDWKGALVAGAGAAVLSLGKGLLARLRGSPESASLR